MLLVDREESPVFEIVELEFDILNEEEMVLGIVVILDMDFVSVDITSEEEEIPVDVDSDVTKEGLKEEELSSSLEVFKVDNDIGKLIEMEDVTSEMKVFNVDVGIDGSIEEVETCDDSANEEMSDDEEPNVTE